MEKKGAGFLLLLHLAALSGLAQDKNGFFGYFENRFFLLDDKSMPWSRPNEKFSIADYNRLRLQGKLAAGGRAVFHAALDLFTFQGALQTPLGVAAASESARLQGEQGRIALDRAYLDLYLGKSILSVGKQRVALGVSYLWAPLDIFNRVNLFEPKEEKPGANAAKLFLPLAGGSTSLTAVFAPEADFAGSKSAVRAQTRFGRIDAALTLLRWGERRTTVVGLDLRGENLVGWWLEGGCFAGASGMDWKLVAGWDYTFALGRGLYWLSEYFHDSSGARDPSGYDPAKLQAGGRFTLGRSYFFSMLRFPLSEVLAASCAYIGNWGDGSWIANPALHFDATQDLTLSTGCYLTAGSLAGEFSRGRRNMFFLWMKFNF